MEFNETKDDDCHLTFCSLLLTAKQESGKEFHLRGMQQKNWLEW